MIRPSTQDKCRREMTLDQVYDWWVWIKKWAKPDKNTYEWWDRRKTFENFCIWAKHNSVRIV